ncbi:unnamed protein product, partial [Rotaria sp. Silwood2]
TFDNVITLLNRKAEREDLYIYKLVKTDKPIHARAHDVISHTVGFNEFSPKEIMVRAGEDSKMSVPFVGPLAS